jgi:hypothetical protein
VVLFEAFNVPKTGMVLGFVCSEAHFARFICPKVQSSVQWVDGVFIFHNSFIMVLSIQNHTKIIDNAGLNMLMMNKTRLM